MSTSDIDLVRVRYDAACALRSSLALVTEAERSSRARLHATSDRLGRIEEAAFAIEVCIESNASHE